VVSSKCFQVESPSPLRFLAALMPPWAQTECERFTGTMENKSTSPPISAILMTAESPARPPPITMIFGWDAMLRIYRLSLALGRARPGFHQGGAGGVGGLLREALPQTVEAGDAHCAQHHEKSQAHDQKSLPRFLARSDPPLGGK